MGVCRDAYRYGFQRGEFFASGVEWTRADHELGRGADCQCGRREECRECVGYAARMAEETDRQVSPFEVYAHEYNTARDPEAAWKWYEKGIDAGVRKGLSARFGRLSKRYLPADLRNPNCADCGKVFDPPPPNGASGYAILREEGEKDGARVCYPCSDKRQRAEFNALPIGGKFTVYVSSDGKTLTTWPGGRLADVLTEKKWHGWGNVCGRSAWFERAWYTARGDNGARWIGQGTGRAMCLNVRRVR